MKKMILLSLVSLFLTSNIFAQNDDNAEKEAIKKVIQSAYIDGLQNKGKIEDIKKGFHPGFDLLGLQNNMLTKFPIYSWIQSTEARKKQDPNPPDEKNKVTCEFPLIDITGTAAVAKIKFLKGGEHIYTDYLSLYKFEQGWRIVNKIYFKHK